MKIKTFIFICLIISSTLSIFASDTGVDGIYYIFNSYSRTATVTFRGAHSMSYDEEYSGNIVIPDSVTYNGICYCVNQVGEYAFYDCNKLESVILPNTITSIADQAFLFCGALKVITMPIGLTSIGEHVFSYPGLSGNIPAPIEIMIFDANNLEEYFKTTANKVMYDAGITYSREFRVNGKSIVDLIVPETIDTISDFLFYNCDNITTITLHENCKLLKKAAFYACSNLIGVFLKSKTPPILQSSMFNSTPLCYIPCGTLENYATSAWRNYTPTFVEQTGYNLSITSSNNLYGIAKITSRIDCETVMLTAIPNDGCTFIKWSDGNTQATRYLQLTEDTNLTAYFAKEGYNIHIYQDCNTTIE